MRDFDPDVPAIEWEHEWDAAVARARDERRLLLVDVERQH